MENRFEPALYSLEANKFIVEHAGEPPEIAFKEGIPGNMARADIYPIIDKLYRLDQENKHSGKAWAGLEAVKKSASNYLTQHAKWAAAHKRGGPANPSMYTWDARGRGFLGAVGSDSGVVKSYFDQNGDRQPLGVELIDSGVQDYIPDWINKETPVVENEFTDLVDDPDNGIIQCPICKFSQNYQVGSQSRRNVAKARIGRHLRSAKVNVELHRQLYTHLFGSSNVTSEVR